MSLLVEQKWADHQRFMAQFPNTTDSVLVLHAFCSKIELGQYRSAENDLRSLTERKAFPCMDDVLNYWIWEIRSKEKDTLHDISSSVNLLLQELRNQNSPCS